jgi:hypothetical protein
MPARVLEVRAADDEAFLQGDGVANGVEGALPLLLRARDHRGALGDPTLELRVAALLRGVKPGVLNGRCDERPQLLERVEVGPAERRPLRAAHGLDHADELIGDDEGHGDERVRLEARARVERPVDERAVLHVRPQHALPCSGDVTGDALALGELGFQKHLARSTADGVEDELLARGVVDEDRRAVGFEQGAQALGRGALHSGQAHLR